MSCETGKVRYRDRLGALIALSNTERRGRDELRVYRCEFCKGWHLTQQRKRATYEPDPAVCDHLWFDTCPNCRDAA